MGFRCDHAGREKNSAMFAWAHGLWRCRRRKRLRLCVVLWTWLGLSALAFLNLVLNHLDRTSSVAVTFHGGEMTSQQDGSGQRSCYGSASLPPSVQLHCRMYHDGLISGDLCSPLCDLGHVCDLTATYGHAHKEVMVGQCHAVCGGQGDRSVKAVLKHDESSSSPGGYEIEYSRMSEAGAARNNSHDRRSLVQLLRRHLLAKDVQEFLDSQLQGLEAGKGGGDPASHSLPAVLYNSLVLLFRQKEYVLFQAYRHKRVFPKVYGTCGPLYLVEYCRPLLQAVRENPITFHPSESSGRTGKSDSSGDERGASGSHPAESFITEKQYLRKETASWQGGFVHKLLVKLHLLHDAVTRSTVSAGSLHDSEAEAGPQNHELEVTQRISRADFSQQGRSSDPPLPRADSSAVTVLDLSPNRVRRSGAEGSRPWWGQRVSVAASILRFLRRLERADALTEHVRLCDPKLEHFALSADDSRIRLVDADLVLFDAAVTADGLLPEAAGVGACAEHEDCSDVMCRGWCDKGSGRCERIRTNNNLQGICLNVFLRPSLQFGPLFVHVPLSAHADVTTALCNCANRVTTQRGIPMQKPPAAVRENLLHVLEKSLLAQSPLHKDTEHGFLIGDC